VGTFAQWVKLQEDRQDGIGYFARTWSSVTPGKISSVDGIKRHLDRMGKQAAESGNDRAIAAYQAAESGYHLAVREYHQVQAQANAEAQGLTVSKPEPPPDSVQLFGNDPYPERAAGQRVPEPPPGEHPARAVGAASPFSKETDLSRSPDVRELMDPVIRGQHAADLSAEPPRLHGSAGAVQPASGQALPEAAARAGKYTGWPESRFERIEHRLEVIERKLTMLLDLLFPEPLDWDALYAAADAYESQGGDGQ
jgi:hypothetical protein